MAMGTPAVSDEDQPVNSELEWKNGSGAYTTSPGCQLGDLWRRGRPSWQIGRACIGPPWACPWIRT